MIAGRMVEEHDATGRPYATMLRELARPLGSRMIATEFDADSDEGSAFLRATDVCVFLLTMAFDLLIRSLCRPAHDLPMVATRGKCPESPFIEVVICFFASPNRTAMAEAMVPTRHEAALRAVLSAGASQTGI